MTLTDRNHRVLDPISPAVEVLFKEARQRRRRRRGSIAAIVMLCVGVGLLLAERGTTTPPRGSTPLPTPIARFVQRADKGAMRSFTAWYQITGTRTGIVEVAQRKPPPSLNPGSGTWSYVFEAQSGFSSQWVQRGLSSWDCWRAFGIPAWSCSGPGTYHGSIGYALSVEPFIPLDIRSQGWLFLEARQPGNEVEHVSTFPSHSSHFGDLDCLKVAAKFLGSPVTMCIDRNGVLVSEHGWPDDYFSGVELLRYSPSVRPSAFQLKGTSNSSGTSFQMIPN